MKADDEAGTWTLVLEDVLDAVLIDSVDRPRAWTARQLDCAIAGLSALHAVWYGRDAELQRMPWIGYVACSSDMTDMSDLWTAVASHAAPRFSAWADPAIASIQRRLIASVDSWWRPLEDSPRTLIHNDFNPRNICLRPSGKKMDGLRLCAYDWELATLGAPQHDLAELLCFVLPSDASADDLGFWVERHRAELARLTGIRIDAREWTLGFRAALFDLMLNRLPMYALVHRVRPQRFLPRVVNTWRRLYELSLEIQ
jgi:hypothetical protein